MQAVLGITGPIFFIIMLGYLAARFGPLANLDNRALGVFVIDFGLPVLLFKALSERPQGQLLNLDLLLAYGLGSLLVMVLVITVHWALDPRKSGLHKASLWTMGMTLSNSAFIGLPVAEALFGPVASASLAVYLTVENLVMIPLLMMVLEFSRKTESHWLKVLQGIFIRIVKNPLILGIVAGALFSALELRLPASLGKVIGLLAAAAPPLALFYIGTILARLSLKGMMGEMTLLALGKLILHPLLVFAGLTLLAFPDPLLKKAAIINAGMPMATLFPLLGQKYGAEGFCAAALVLATMLAFFTLTGLIWLVGGG